MDGQVDMQTERANAPVCLDVAQETDTHADTKQLTDTEGGKSTCMSCCTENRPDTDTKQLTDTEGGESTVLLVFAKKRKHTDPKATKIHKDIDTSTALHCTHQLVLECGAETEERLRQRRLMVNAAGQQRCLHRRKKRKSSKSNDGAEIRDRGKMEEKEKKEEEKQEEKDREEIYRRKDGKREN
jgi:hypothetical protein